MTFDLDKEDRRNCYTYFSASTFSITWLLSSTGIVELYRFAKRVHVASRGPGKKCMSPTTSECNGMSLHLEKPAILCTLTV